MNEQKEKTMTRAQKTEATKGIIKELLAVKPTRHNELIDEVAKLYVERHEDAENINDVKGRAGSVLDIMKKESEVAYDGGMYALKARLPQPPPVEEPPAPAKKQTKTRVKKAEPKKEEAEAEAPKKKGRAKKVEPTKEEPASPASEKKTVKTRAKKAEPVKEEKEEVKAAEPKKRGRAKKTELVKEEASAPVEEPLLEQPSKTEEKALPVQEEKVEKSVVKEEKGELVVKPNAELVQKELVDMSFLFGTPKKAPAPAQKKPPVEEKKTPAPNKNAQAAQPIKAAEKPVTVSKATTQTTVAKEKTPAAKTKRTTARKAAEKPMTAEEKLKESFLKRLRALGGDYFEYYSVYLLERYSMKNGRRLEGLSISGGDHDGGIDGEIVLTDKLGFKETIYIQSKNWDPSKGKEENWVVGETLLQQFIGACACRQAKERKQHCRGIFITTSRFTPDAERILNDMSDRVIGYDGNDLFEAAKECAFGLIQKNGEWSLDEKLLSGTKAFFEML